MVSARVARRFEQEFKDNANHGIAVDLTSNDFVHHIYRVAGGRIAELWPAGGPQLG